MAAIASSAASPTLAAPPPGAPSTTRELADMHRLLTRFLYAHFHRALGDAECADAASDAIFEAQRASDRGVEIRDLDAWLCRAAYCNALSALRKIRGEGTARRERPETLGSAAELVLDSVDLEGEITHEAGRDADGAALVAAWKALRPDEQRVLHLRYFAEMPVEEVMKLLGCSRTHYENLTKRGIRKLRKALVDGPTTTDCREWRALLLVGDDAEIPPDVRARRDAHLVGCLTCRAFRRKGLGLMAFAPVPALTVADRFTARLHGLLPHAHDAASTGEVIAGTAAAGTTGAGGVLAAVGTTKTLAVVCSTGALAAGVCATVPAVAPDRRAERHASATPQHKDAAEPVKARAATSASVPPALPAQAPAARATTTAATSDERARRDDQRRTTERQRRATKRRNREDASPFLPESAADPEPAQEPVASTATKRTTGTTAGSPTTSAPPTQVESSASSGSSAGFSDEFTP